MRKRVLMSNAKCPTLCTRRLRINTLACDRDGGNSYVAMQLLFYVDYLVTAHVALLCSSNNA